MASINLDFEDTGVPKSKRFNLMGIDTQLCHTIEPSDVLWLNLENHNTQNNWWRSLVTRTKMVLIFFFSLTVLSFLSDRVNKFSHTLRSHEDFAVMIKMFDVPNLNKTEQHKLHE